MNKNKTKEKLKISGTKQIKRCRFVMETNFNLIFSPAKIRVFLITKERKKNIQILKNTNTEILKRKYT